MAIVRAYQPDDLSACRRLWEVLTERHRLIYDDPSIGGDDAGSFFDAHLARVGPDNIWVAEEDGAVVGMSGLIVGDGEAEIEPVVVEEALRSRGIGTLLLNEGVARAKRLGVQYLNIAPVARNSRAIELFVRAGFRLVGHLQLFIELEGRPGQPARSPRRSPGDLAKLTEILAEWS
jgi:GNAT superfamily N-acetyltransferase